MGKIRRQRKKLHLEAQAKPLDQAHGTTEKSIETETTPLLITPQDNIFGSLQINIDSLNKNLSDDIRSVKSFKSVKSETGKAISKKDKIKMRRELLMKKFEVVNQQKIHDKKKNTPIVGDLNPLHDALPSLESLLKSRGNVQYKKNAQPKKKKGIEKANKLKKNHLQGIKNFQQIFKNKQYQKDPQLAIAQHVTAVLEHEKTT